jgi:hypothetical protein
LANQSAGNPPQPQNLGLGFAAFDVPSSDAPGYSLAPILGPSTGYSAPDPLNYADVEFGSAVTALDDTTPGYVQGGAVIEINGLHGDKPVVTTENGVEE